MSMKDTSTWWCRYLKQAEEVAQWSKDPSKKVGAVIVGSHGQIVSTGYNGFPRGIEDSEERYADRETKYRYVVHAEMNAIYNACLTGVSLKDAHLYVWGLPVCTECAKGVIQAGISKVIIPHPHLTEKLTVRPQTEWHDRWLISKEMFSEAGVQVREILNGEDYYHVPGR